MKASVLSETGESLSNSFILKRCVCMLSAQALLARYSPLGSSSCPLFARKFGELAVGRLEQAAAEYLAPA